MNELKKTPALLPKGFEDLLPVDAQGEADAISTLMQVFSSYDYQRIKPPMVEFEQSMLGAGPGEKLTDQTFRVMDRETGKMLAIRSDVTPQIARIATTRLADVPRPLRLSYANDVLRMSGSQQRTLRQFCQVGCELIDDVCEDNLSEIIVLAAKGLKALGIGDISFDFALPEIFDELLAVTDTGADDIDRLRADLSGDAASAYEKIKALEFSAGAREDIERLGRLIDAVKTQIDGQGISGVGFTIDPLETKGFEYHRGIAFTIFAKGVNGEIGRGGGYMLGGNERASGFTLYMDTVRQAQKKSN